MTVSALLTRFVARKLSASRRRLAASGSESSATGRTSRSLSRLRRGRSVAAEPAGYSVYDALLKDELTAQDVRKESFERRGLAVITTAGTLVTLLFALAALSTRSAATFDLPQGALPFLVAGLICFGLAALVALSTNVPATYSVVEVKDVEKRLLEAPVRSENRALKDVALLRTETLEAARSANKSKGEALILALRLEAAAIVLVGVAVGIILLTG